VICNANSYGRDPEIGIGIEQVPYDVLDMINDGICLTDQYGKVLFINSRMPIMFGCTMSEMRGSLLLEFVSKDCKERFLDFFKRVQDTNLEEANFSFLKKDGQNFLATLLSKIVIDSSGEPEGFLVVITDKSETKTLREELLRQKEEQQIIFDLVPAMIWYKDRNNKILRCNDLAAKVKGMNVEEMENRYTSELYPDEADSYYRDDMDVIESGIPKYGIIELHEVSNGKKIWVKTDKIPYTDKKGTISGVVVFATDITQLKQAEGDLIFLSEASALLATSIDYRTTLKQVAQLIVPRLADWCIIDLKEADLVQRVEVAHFNPMHSHLADVILKNPPDFGSKSPLMQAMRTGKSILAPETESGQFDYSEEDMRDILKTNPKSYIIIPLISRGQTLGILTLISTESNRSYSGRDLPLIEDLARRAACAIDNAKLYQEAQKVIQMREDFLAVASHELKTPITAHRLQLQMMRRILNGCKNHQDPIYMKLNRFLEMSDYEIIRLSQLINNLFDMTRISIGSLVLEKSKMDLRSLVQRIVEHHTAASALSRRQICLCADEVVIGHWDYVRLEQVVVNLLSNAIKYGCDRKIEIFVKSENKKAVLIVLDHGLGIPKEFQSKIFDRFERATSEKKASSLGLGLYIVKQIVNAHGGTIEVKSKLNQGSAFRVELPL
jgi:PAS domain S-box-containing protein